MKCWEKIFLTHTQTRRRFGGTPTYMRPSRFIFEIPSKLIEQQLKKESFTSKPKTVNSSFKYSPPISTKSDELKVGSQVHHKLFGPGILKNIEGTGEDAKLTIKFSGNQIKKLIRKYANLKLNLEL